MQEFYSPGKLLISGEYVVLDGATALALPTKFGQSLQVKEIIQPFLKWKSFDHNGQIWIEENFSIEEILKPKSTVATNSEEVLEKLFLVLQSAAEMNPEAFSAGNGFELISKLDFPGNWGLGSSSTLIANIAKWLSIDAYTLLDKTFGGSGYDIAVALNESPITYQKQAGQKSILATSFDPEFKEQLFFVHLNQKQNSRESIQHYRSQERSALETAAEKITSLTHEMIACDNLRQFELLIEIHENIISQLIDLPKVKSGLFPDYSGAIKSLGGWGGDFLLATGSANQMDYFRQKGFSTILSYSEMIGQ